VITIHRQTTLKDNQLKSKLKVKVRLERIQMQDHLLKTEAQ